MLKNMFVGTGLKSLYLIMLLVSCATSGANLPTLAAPPEIPDGIPDLIREQGPSVEEAKPDWFLHCGGSRGWIYRDDSGNCDQARQILVTKVPGDSAVRHELKVGDVILGVNGTYFSKHAVYEFREASLPAKSKEGTFQVILWRKEWQKPRSITLDLSPKPLDFTRGDTPGLAVDWNLGPTGARGWIEGKHEESLQSRQILITTIHKGSPADGILESGDVILGINGKHFDRDARRSFGEAITAAETEAGKGQLNLMRWRPGETKQDGKGTTENVTISIPVLGTYSKSTPWDCPKTAQILDNACAYLIEKDVLNSNDVGNGPANIAALALLATGNPEHQKLAKAYVYKLLGSMEKDKGYPPVWGYATWGWSYGNLLMTEYYLLTRDKTVLPAIERYSNLLAEGQSGAGSWGHRLAAVNHGPCPGYGAMNQCGTIAWMSLILAKRCGVTNPEIDQAIVRGKNYLSTFLGRQPIPYGDHISLKPNGHDDNGKTSAAACAYSLLGDQEGTDFHSRMTVASYAVRERGHTGSWWSALWGPLGAARAGKSACGAFLNEMTWLYDLERRWDGGFVYQGKAGVGYGVNPETGRQKGGREHNNAHWDTTGSRILMYCLPRKRLCITGRDALTVPIPADEIASVIEAGRPSPKGNRHATSRFDDRPTEELLQLLGSWSPVARYHAACSLVDAKGIASAKITPLLNSENTYLRYGACQALRQMGPNAADAVPQLVKLLESDNRLLQIYTIAALGDIGNERAVPPLLKMAGKTFEGDTTGVMQRMVARALFNKGGLLHDSIDGVDRELLYPAITGILRCNGGHERSMVAAAVLKKLTFEELQPLWPAMIESLRQVAPSGIMFASGVRTTVATLLADNRVDEGMELILEYMKRQKRHGAGERSKLIMDQLVKYGAAAKPLIPAMEKYIEYCEIDRPWTDLGRPARDGFYKGQIPHLKAAIKAISESEDTPELRSIKSD